MLSNKFNFIFAGSLLLTACHQTLFEEVKDLKNLSGNPDVLKSACQLYGDEWGCSYITKIFRDYGNEETKFQEYKGKKFVQQLICTLPNCNRFTWIFIGEDSKMQIYGGENMNIHVLIYHSPNAKYYSKAPLMVKAWGISDAADIPPPLLDTFEKLNRSYVNPEITNAYLRTASGAVDANENIRYYFDKKQR